MHACTHALTHTRETVHQVRTGEAAVARASAAGAAASEARAELDDMMAEAGGIKAQLASLAAMRAEGEERLRCVWGCACV